MPQCSAATTFIWLCRYLITDLQHIKWQLLVHNFIYYTMHGKYMAIPVYRIIYYMAMYRIICYKCIKRGHSHMAIVCEKLLPHAKFH